MTENGIDIKDIPLDEQKKLLTILNDSATIIKFKDDKEVSIKPLRVYSKRLIADIAWNIKHTDESTENVILSMAKSVEPMARMIAILLCNDKFTKDYEANERLIEDKTREIELEADNWEDWGNILITTLNLLDIGFFFSITKLSQMFLEMTTANKAMTMKKMKEQSK